MALPKRKHSTGRKGKRRAAIRLKLPTLVPCPKCDQLKKPHQVCPNCGWYKGREVTKAKTEPVKRKGK